METNERSQFHDCPVCGAGGIIPDEDGRCTHCGASMRELGTATSRSQKPGKKHVADVAPRLANKEDKMQEQPTIEASSGEDSSNEESKIKEIKRRLLALFLGAIAIAILAIRVMSGEYIPSMEAPKNWMVLSQKVLREDIASLKNMIPESQWRGMLSSGGLVSCFYESNDDIFENAAITICVVQGQLQLTDRPFAEVVSEVRRDLSSLRTPVKFSNISDIELATVIGQSALRVSFDMSYGSDLLQTIQYLVPAGNRTVVVTFCATKYFYSVFQDDFEAAVQTLYLPREVPPLFLSILTGVGVGGLVFAWLMWSRSSKRNQTEPQKPA